MDIAGPRPHQVLSPPQKGYLMAQTSEQPRNAFAIGLIAFAAVAMIVIGAFQVIQGLVSRGSGR